MEKAIGPLLIEIEMARERVKEHHNSPENISKLYDELKQLMNLYCMLYTCVKATHAD